MASTSPTSAVTPTTGVRLPALASTYVSPAYGYTISYPQGWTITNGNAPWPAHTILRHNDPHLDVISGAMGSGTTRFIGASQPVPPGTTLVQFLEWQGQRVDGSTCPAGDYVTGEALPKPVTVDGFQAMADLDGCGSFAEFGGVIWDIVVITTDSRGYNFTFDGALHAEDVVAWLSTVKLDPSTALDGG